jgi:septum site-determining protein MinC
MEDETVAIKGTKEGLLISLSSTEEWLTVTGNLAARLDERSEFFDGARITVDLGQRPVPRYELTGLKALLERRGLSLEFVMSDSETTLEAAQALDVRTGVSTEGTSSDALPISPEETGIPGVMFKRTLRSGRVVRSEGHVIVIGDVNPGAEIIAGGDVIVWGRLRGNVHAGVDGDEGATVCALEMKPNQLRIASYITTSPQDTKRHKTQPEMAFIHNQQIVVETWKH